MSKSLLVTGAYGFIGRHVARHYANAGWVVVGMGHGSWIQNEWHQWGLSEWHVADITLESLMTYGGSPDLIVHCAGSGSVAYSMTHPLQDFQRTVVATIALLEFVRIYVPQARVVYPSSAGVYGVAESLPIAESALTKPASPYGVHKKISEDLCRSYAQNFGLSVAIVRFFSVYGVGLRKQLLWDACLKIKRNETAFFGGGSETRDWLHINDAVALLMVAAEHASPSCAIVNGGSGISPTVKDVLGEIFKIFGRNDEPKFQGVSRSGDPLHYMADISLAKTWSHVVSVSWRDGVREYVDWFKKGAP